MHRGCSLIDNFTVVWVTIQSHHKIAAYNTYIQCACTPTCMYCTWKFSRFYYLPLPILNLRSNHHIAQPCNVHTHTWEVESFQNVQCQQCCYSLTVWRHLPDIDSPVGGLDGRVKSALVTLQVLCGHTAAMLLHTLGNGFCYPTFVEASLTLLTQGLNGKEQKFQ